VCTSEGVVVVLKTAGRFHGISKTTTELLLYVNEDLRLSSERPVICNGTLHTVVIYWIIHPSCEVQRLISYNLREEKKRKILSLKNRSVTC
jgi:hypothetical protein